MNTLTVVLLILIPLTIGLYVWFFRARKKDFSAQSRIPLDDEQHPQGDRHERTPQSR
jgi:cbb3-type cytochrome oxidase subunit 3